MMDRQIRIQGTGGGKAAVIIALILGAIGIYLIGSLSGTRWMAAFVPAPQPVESPDFAVDIEAERERARLDVEEAVGQWRLRLEEPDATPTNLLIEQLGEPEQLSSRVATVWARCSYRGDPTTWYAHLLVRGDHVTNYRILSADETPASVRTSLAGDDEAAPDQ